MKKNKFFFILAFFTVFAISFLGGIASTERLYIRQLVNDVESGKQVATTWACYDGCYNMIEVFGGYNNLTKPYSEDIKEDLYQPCADMCFQQYFNISRFK